jgi:hypothetical protein
VKKFEGSRGTSERDARLLFVNPLRTGKLKVLAQDKL